jgi:hypothetical protein
MNESASRTFLLVRAVEITDAQRQLWSDEDRAWATRAAAEVVGSGASADAFLARRAELALERLGTRSASIPRALHIAAWRPWIGWIAVLLAFAAGLATDQIGAGKRVNVLALPLLGLLTWNLLVYGLVLVRALAALAGRARLPGPLRALIARLGHATLPPLSDREPVVARALGAFAAHWGAASLPLAAARVARILHLCALAFAVGNLAGMYTRGMVLEYRAGWESTFLDAQAVSAILHTILGPASAITGIALPDAPRLEAMRFEAGAGENAAPWLHLYAVTIALFVLVPRGILAAVARAVERRKAGRLVDPSGDVYAQRLVRQLRGDSSTLRVVPYAVEVSANARTNLLSLMARVYGAKAHVDLSDPVAWGAEEAIDLSEGFAEGTSLWALFSLSATPERENHGAFLAALRARLAGVSAPLAIVDESAFRRRFADTPGRLQERSAAWQALFDESRVQAVFVDLEHPDFVAAENAMNTAIDRNAHSRR